MCAHQYTLTQTNSFFHTHTHTHHTADKAAATVCGPCLSNNTGLSDKLCVWGQEGGLFVTPQHSIAAEKESVAWEHTASAGWLVVWTTG